MADGMSRRESPQVPPMPSAPPPPATPPVPTDPVPEPEMPRRDSINPLWLAGWDRYSTWGYDSGTGSYYAQLYRNSADRDGPPTVWLDGVAERIHRLPVLYVRIGLETREPLSSVYEALLHQLPDGVHQMYRHPTDPVAPQGLRLSQIRYQLGEMDTETPYERGAEAALRWTVGDRADAPCSGSRVAGQAPGTWPSPLVLTAEEWAATAAVYMTAVPDQAAGAEAALRWALGKSPTAP